MDDQRLHPARGQGVLAATPDLLGSVRLRLAALAVLAATGSVVYLILGGLAWRRASVDIEVANHLFAERVVTTTLSVVLALVVVLLSRRSEDASRLEGLGVGLVLALAALSGYGRYDLIHHTQLGMGTGWSGVSLLIVLLPVLDPISPRRALLAGLGALALDLGAYTLNPLLSPGAAMPDTTEYVLVFRGDLVAAGVAWAVAHIVDDLRIRLHSAQRLGSYELLERIGVGGMGEVWRGRHGLLARPAAIKLIKHDTLERLGEEGQAMMIARFEREAQATALLECRHTIDIYDFGVASDGTLYYAMELLEGVDLHELVIAQGRMPAARVAYLMLQMCESLAEAHARGLIHRDIKPSNLFLCRYGGRHDFIKVLDFGLVKLIDLEGPEAAQLTGDGTTGTPAFLPPEQGISGREIDARSDIYALGCVGYWLLTDHFVFEAKTAAEYIVKHVSEEPVAPSARVGVEVPADLEALILQALAKDPDARPQSAEALAAAIRATGLAAGWSEAAAARWWTAYQAGASIRQAYAEPEAVAPTEVLAEGQSVPATERLS